jgi:hypothetical protein
MSSFRCPRDRRPTLTMNVSDCGLRSMRFKNRAVFWHQENCSQWKTAYITPFHLSFPTTSRLSHLNKFKRCPASKRYLNCCQNRKTYGCPLLSRLLPGLQLSEAQCLAGNTRLKRPWLISASGRIKERDDKQLTEKLAGKRSGSDPTKEWREVAIISEVTRFGYGVAAALFQYLSWGPGSLIWARYYGGVCRAIS